MHAWHGNVAEQSAQGSCTRAKEQGASGTATTKIVTPVMKNSSHCAWWMLLSQASLQHSLLQKPIPLLRRPECSHTVPAYARLIALFMCISHAHDSALHIQRCVGTVHAQAQTSAGAAQAQ